MGSSANRNSRKVSFWPADSFPPNGEMRENSELKREFGFSFFTETITLTDSKGCNLCSVLYQLFRSKFRSPLSPASDHTMLSCELPAGVLRVAMKLNMARRNLNLNTASVTLKRQLCPIVTRIRTVFTEAMSHCHSPPFPSFFYFLISNIYKLQNHIFKYQIQPKTFVQS